MPQLTMLLYITIHNTINSEGSLVTHVGNKYDVQGGFFCSIKSAWIDFGIAGMLYAIDENIM